MGHPGTTIQIFWDGTCVRTTMLEPMENNPEEAKIMEIMIEGFTKWSVDRMNLLTGESRVDDATAIYYEFEEWLDPDMETDVVVIDDMNFEE